MTFIEDSAREFLKAAQSDFVKARRTLWLGASLLALIHLLTVYPYLEASREIAQLKLSTARNAELLAQLDPQMKRLKSAGSAAGDQLGAMLRDATQEMIRDFARLRDLVRRAQQGDVPDASSLSGASGAPPQAQMQQMSLNVQVPAESRESNDASLARSEDEVVELSQVLKAIAGSEPDAQDQLRTYARRRIVERAYARVQRAWSQDVRPAYLDAMSMAEKQARDVADQATVSAPDTAAKLRDAAKDLATQRTVIEAIKISPDNTVNAALGTEWWRTVEGKGQFADSLSDSVRTQLTRIDNLAATPSEAIKETLELQRELRDQLDRKQKEIERQFDQQRQQLATLSGAAGILPVDLASFIGLFPLLLGLILGFLMLRSAQVRRDAANAAADLAVAAPDDRDTRMWLARRVLGGADARGPQLTSAALALGIIAWIALAAVQVSAGDMTPPLAPWASAALAAIMVVGAAAWDVAAIRRLAALARP